MRLSRGSKTTQQPYWPKSMRALLFQIEISIKFKLELTFIGLKCVKKSKSSFIFHIIDLIMHNNYLFLFSFSYKWNIPAILIITVNEIHRVLRQNSMIYRYMIVLNLPINIQKKLEVILKICNVNWEELLALLQNMWLTNKWTSCIWLCVEKSWIYTFLWKNSAMICGIRRLPKKSKF